MYGQGGIACSVTMFDRILAREILDSRGYISIEGAVEFFRAGIEARTRSEFLRGEPLGDVIGNQSL
jgi:hypothetical protein